MEEQTNGESELHPEWRFQFILQGSDGKSPVPESRCDELLALIIEWAEINNFAIGGGYEKYRYDSISE